MQPAMKPPPFSYHDPRTVADAVALLGRLDNAKLLAGGQSLMPMLNFRFVQPDHIIDLNRVEGLSYIREANGALEIGAMTRQRDLEFSDVVRARLPIMHEALLQVGHRQTRNRGTIGGSLCHLDPAAELVSLATGYDATVTVAGPNGERQIPFAQFPVAYMTPAIEPTEILVGVRFPQWAPRHGYAFVEFSRRHGDFAITSAAALLEADAGGKITRASVTIGGMGTAPVRARELEQAITGQAPSAQLLRDACESCRKLEAIDDIHAPASYRQHLAAVLSRRALEKAHARLTGADTGQARPH
jgi:carbon-monoxide dehydrogenase medium subunit